MLKTAKTSRRNRIAVYGDHAIKELKMLSKVVVVTVSRRHNH
jgi:hypothetical protein